MIEVTLEHPELGALGFEDCCICRVKTRYWYLPNDVACCEACARYADPAQIPTKKEWVANARAARED